MDLREGPTILRNGPDCLEISREIHPPFRSPKRCFAVQSFAPLAVQTVVAKFIYFNHHNNLMKEGTYNYKHVVKPRATCEHRM